MIIVHARSTRLFTHSTSLTCLHYSLKGNTTPCLRSRQPQHIRKDTKKWRSGAYSQTLANQTRAAESLNITTSKIRAGVWLARTPVQTHSTQHSFLWQIMCLPPQITGNRESTVISVFCDCFGLNCVINQTCMWWNVAAWKQSLNSA